MKRCLAVWTGLVAALLVLEPGAVVRADSTLARSFDAGIVVPAGSPVLVTVRFTNGEATVLRGFFCTEQLPSTLAITPLTVSVSGQAVTNYLLEAGQDGDVSSGCTPYRWVLEQPTNFAAANPLPPGGNLQIQYQISSVDGGSFALNGMTWAAFDPVATNAFFGYTDDANAPTLQFVSSVGPATVFLSAVTNGAAVNLVGAAGCQYRIDFSTNLWDWSPLATGISPFVFIDTNGAPGGGRFYRGCWPP